MADSRTIEATCSCGNIKRSIALPTTSWPLEAAICHCNSCRHMTGIGFLSFAQLPENYKPNLDGLQRFKFSENADHFFCPKCGTDMFSRYMDGWSVMMGTLEEGDTSVFNIEAHVFLEDTMDGGFADFLTGVEEQKIKRFAGDIGTEEVPLYWTSPNRASIKRPAPEERLHGYCKCRGVEFWISQPSRRSVYAKEAYEGRPIPDEDTPLPDEKDTFWLMDNRTRFRAAVCPCDSCRLAGNGNAFAQWAYIPTVDVSLDAAGTVPMPENLQWGTLISTTTSERASQHFCGVCGAVVFWNTVARSWIKDFGVGLFESMDGARAESWFKWRTKDLRHREDGLRRAAGSTLAVEEGLKGYSKAIQSKIAVGESRV